MDKMMVVVKMYCYVDFRPLLNQPLNSCNALLLDYC